MTKTSQKRKLKSLPTVEATISAAFKEAADAISRYVESLQKLDAEKKVSI